MPYDNDTQEACQALNYTVIRDHDEAWAKLNSLSPEVYALDFETTSLDPSEGEVRLSTICGHGEAFIIDHFFAGAFEDYAQWFARREWAVFNAGFEGDWIDYYSENIDVVLYDIGHMRRAKMGGGPLSLKIQAKRDHKVDLVKDEQTSNWSRKELTQSQLDYAMIDGYVTWGSWDKWWTELTDAQWNGFLNINEAWRGTREMEYTGLQLDVEYHSKLLAWWTLKRDTAERYLRRWAPPSVLENLRSKPQLTRFFRDNILTDAAFATWPKTGKRGDLDMTREVLRQAAHRLPYPMSRWVAALIIFNKMEKYVGTYGQKLIDSQIRLRRIPARFNMAAAVTGRYSSSNFNLQNIPRNPVVRRSFVAMREAFLEYIDGVPTDGETRLVMADYSSIEVRVLAELSGDERLLYDSIYGDVHSRSAAQIFRVDYDKFVFILGSSDPAHASLRAVYKDMRSRAKAFTFQLLYGAGAGALAVVLRCTDEEASAAIDAWAQLYPKAYHYRTLMFEQMNHSGFLPVIDGRTMFVFRDDRTMPVAANWPVQGAAASVMYRAVYHTHKDLWESPWRAMMAASVHDELLLFSHIEHADKVATLLIDAMVKGWLDIFPGTDTSNLVGKGNKATIGLHWGEKE